MRYIDADNYKKDLIQLGFLPALVVRVLDKQPTADVVEVRHGEWLERSYGELQCSACGIVQGDEPHRYNYCPNCGAKMDGGEK
jgi:Zn finger protein HypA/HybF involved in hydrogenase expression